MRRRRFTRRLLRIAAATIVIGLLGAAGLYIYIFSSPFPMELLEHNPLVSLRIEDRRGNVLREVLSEKEGRCAWLSRDDISPYLIQATVAAEDERFYSHPGVDVLAVARALCENLRRGRIVSGASTITQQLIRMLQPRARTLGTKISEAILALRLERALDKDAIIVEYLNRAPYGNQLFGASAASWMYFSKPASDLSPAEAALLAALPQSPARLNPYRNPAAALRRQSWILWRMESLGMLTGEEYQRARAEPVVLSPRSCTFRAPHFTDYVLNAWSQAFDTAHPSMTQIAGIASKSRTSTTPMTPVDRIPTHRGNEPGLPEVPRTIRTTLDSRIQSTVESILCAHSGRLAKAGARNAAVVVLDVPSGEIVAMAGSLDFFDEDAAGQVNGALAHRSPGSTLKPFTYALAIEAGFAASSIILDEETHFFTPEGDYCPRNYDGKTYGPVRLRMALANSLNIPAVRVLNSIGVQRLYQCLKSMEFQGLTESPEHYGLGLALGDCEVSLLELTNAYATLARGGIWLPPKAIRLSAWLESGLLARQCRSSVECKGIAFAAVLQKQSFCTPQSATYGRRILEASTCYIISEILSDSRARAIAFGRTSSLDLPFRAAAKTGTSPDFKDNWVVGYTPDYAVGVWVGNSDGSPLNSSSGISGAGPIFHEIMRSLHKEKDPSWSVPSDDVVSEEICTLTGLAANPQCPSVESELFRIQSPPHGDRTSQCDTHTDSRMPPARNRNRAAPIIIHPNDWDVFSIDAHLPNEYQTVGLRALASEDTDALEWYIDGRHYAIALPGEALRWPLEIGTHEVVVVDSLGNRSVTVRFVVH